MRGPGQACWVPSLAPAAARQHCQRRHGGDETERRDAGDGRQEVDPGLVAPHHDDWRQCPRAETRCGRHPAGRHAGGRHAGGRLLACQAAGRGQCRGRIHLAEPDARAVAARRAVLGGADQRLGDKSRREPGVSGPDECGDSGDERRGGTGAAAAQVDAPRPGAVNVDARSGDDDRSVSVRERRAAAVGVHGRDRYHPGEGCGIGVRGEAAGSGAVVARRCHHNHPAGDRVPDREPQVAGRARRPERHVDHPGTTPDGVTDSLGNRVVIAGILAVGAEPGLLIIQDDADGQDSRRRRHPDHSGCPAGTAAVARDDRGDVGPVQVRRLIAGRIGACGVIRSGEHRPGEIGGTGIGAGVKDRDDDAIAPAGAPCGGHVDRPQHGKGGQVHPRSGLLGRRDRLAGAAQSCQGRCQQASGRQPGVAPGTAQHDHSRRVQLTVGAVFSGPIISAASCTAGAKTELRRSWVKAAGRPSA